MKNLSNPTDRNDEELVGLAKKGDAKALEEILRRYQGPLYRYLSRMLWSPAAAEDATQEVLIKITTGLGNFRGKSTFRTWAYRIATNHALSEHRRIRFDDYAARIDGCADRELEAEPAWQVAPAVMAEEAKRSCVKGMLLCLDHEQRAAFVLGAVFGMTAPEGAAILGLSQANFRQRLSRARRDLKKFMAGQCGLVNADAPCRCPKKTLGFIDAGVVDPADVRFNPDHVRMASDEAGRYPLSDPRWIGLFSQALEPELPDLAKRIAGKFMSSVLRPKSRSTTGDARNGEPSIH